MIFVFCFLGEGTIRMGLTEYSSKKEMCVLVSGAHIKNKGNMNSFFASQDPVPNGKQWRSERINQFID